MSSVQLEVTSASRSLGYLMGRATMASASHTDSLWHYYIDSSLTLSITECLIDDHQNLTNFNPLITTLPFHFQIPKDHNS